MDIKDYKLGVVDSPLDLRDYDYSMISCVSEKIEIPKEYVLDYKYPILCQGQVGSCVAHALSEMKSYIDAVDITEMYSVGFIYANRQDNDWQGIGMITREALKNLVKFGDCKKTSFPVNEEYPSIAEKLRNSDKNKLLDEADDHKSLAYISLKREEIKEYLFKQKKPILLTCNVYDNFYEANTKKGVIPNIPKGSKKGSHAMLCIGYKEDTLILINSWGDWNGDKGKYYLDLNSSLIKELWALEDKKNVKEPDVKIYKVGWDKNSNGNWIYSNDGESLIKNDWVHWNGKWYFLNEDGTMHTEWLQDSNGRWFYLDIDKGYAYIGWVYINGKWYYFNDDCVMQTGWLQYKDKWYYLDIDKGYCYTNSMVLIDGKNYSFDSDGACIENTKLKGIDISSHNGNIDFNKVKADGVEVVYIKATEGTTFIDSYLSANYCGAKQAKLKTGFYHFLVGTSAPETQAVNFYNQVKDKQNDLKPCLDIETKFDGLMDYALRFIKKFKELSGMNICIYTYSGFVSNLDNRLSDYTIWEANYNNDPWNLPGNSIWDKKAGHQYTEKGSVNGINTNVDLNEFTNDILR